MEKLYLAHHGRLNMKWGVRNGPPYPLDGSVTKGYAKKQASRKPNGEEHEDYKKAHGKGPNYNNNVKEMSDQELRSRLNRLEMERKYKDLSDTTINNGRRKAAQYLKTIGAIAGTTASIITIGKNIPQIVNFFASRHGVIFPVVHSDLAHSAKGTTWEEHKYIKQIDGVYYYPDNYAGGRHLSDKVKQQTEKTPMEDWEKKIHSHIESIVDKNPNLFKTSGDVASNLMRSENLEAFRNTLKALTGMDNIPDDKLKEMRKKIVSYYDEGVASGKTETTKEKKSSSKSKDKKSDKKSDDKKSSNSKSKDKKTEKKETPKAPTQSTGIKYYKNTGTSKSIRSNRRRVIPGAFKL